MQLGELAGLKPAKRLREVFGDAMLDLCRENEKVVVLDGDLASTTKTITCDKNSQNGSTISGSPRAI